jgi:hypothetical protein
MKYPGSEEQDNLCCLELTKWMPCTSDFFIRDLFWSGFHVESRRQSHRRSDQILSCWNLTLLVLKFLFVAIALLYDILQTIFYRIPVSLFRCCRRVNPFNIPPTKCVVYNGYMYATAHFHDVDGAGIVTDGDDFVSVGAGFEIAPGDADDVAVCNAHAWGTRFLAFADGCYNSATKICMENSIVGNSGFTGVFSHFRAQIQNCWDVLCI